MTSRVAIGNGVDGVGRTNCINRSNRSDRSDRRGRRVSQRNAMDRGGDAASAVYSAFLRVLCGNIAERP